VPDRARSEGLGEGKAAPLRRNRRLVDRRPRCRALARLPPPAPRYPSCSWDAVAWSVCFWVQIHQSGRWAAHGRSWISALGAPGARPRRCPQPSCPSRAGGPGGGRHQALPSPFAVQTGAFGSLSALCCCLAGVCPQCGSASAAPSLHGLPGKSIFGAFFLKYP